MTEANSRDVFLAEVDRQRFAIQAALLASAEPLEDPARWVDIEVRERSARSKAVASLGEILDSASLDNFTRDLRAAVVGNDPMQRAIDEVLGDLGSVRRIAIQLAPSTISLEWQARWLDLNATLQKLRSHPVVPGNSTPDAIIQSDGTDDATIDERAVAIKVAHPDWSDQKIANNVVCHVQTLYKPNMVKFKMAKAALKAGRTEHHHGTKYDGNLEAADE